MERRAERTAERTVERVEHTVDWYACQTQRDFNCSWAFHLRALLYCLLRTISFRSLVTPSLLNTYNVLVAFHFCFVFHQPKIGSWKMQLMLARALDPRRVRQVGLLNLPSALRRARNSKWCGCPDRTRISEKKLANSTQDKTGDTGPKIKRPNLVRPSKNTVAS